MLLHRRLPIRLQLAGLAWAAADRAAGLTEETAPQYVDIHGNPIELPVVSNPLTGETTLAPGVSIVQNRAAGGSIEQEGSPFDNSVYESLPGVRSGAIPAGSTSVVVVRPQDVQQAGVVSITPYRAPPTAEQQAAAGTFVGPVRAASIPALVTGGGGGGGMSPLPSAVPGVVPDGGGVDGSAAAPAAKSGAGGLAILAALAFLFAN